MYHKMYLIFLKLIREQITPKGDGNNNFFIIIMLLKKLIREQITPKGDGNEKYGI